MSYTQKEYDQDKLLINVNNYKALADKHALLSASLITNNELTTALIHAQLATAFALMIKE